MSEPQLAYVRSLWLEDTLPPLFESCLLSFVSRGHPVELFSYSKLKISPRIRVRDANEIIPEKQIFRYPNGSVAVFANYFRYAMLKELGDWWVDTDVYCIAPLPTVPEVVFGQESPARYNNAVLSFPPNHPALDRLISICENPNQFLPWDNWNRKWRKLRRRYLGGNDLGNLKWGETGPSLLAQVAQEFELDQFALGEEAFYPVAGADWQRLFTQPVEQLALTSEKNHTVHLWNEHSKNFDLSDLHPDSLVARILAEKEEFCA